MHMYTSSYCSDAALQFCCELCTATAIPQLTGASFSAVDPIALTGTDQCTLLMPHQHRAHTDPNGANGWAAATERVLWRERQHICVEKACIVLYISKCRLQAMM